MPSFPNPKVHRRSRRKLGRGQYPLLPSTSVVVTPSTAVVTLDFPVPVVVSGTISLHLTRVSPAVPALLWQVVVSATQVVQTYASTVAGCDWSIADNDPAVRTYSGGGLAASSGSFP